MLPLFIKDGLILPFIATSVLFNVIVHVYFNCKKKEDNKRFWLCMEQLIPPKFTNCFREIFKLLVIFTNI